MSMIYGHSVISDAAKWRPAAPILIRKPVSPDGPAVWQLIDSAPQIDSNSLYCNLLQCSHFASTCAIAEREGMVVGWLSGHVPPKQPETLFVWQVCVGESARGLGLGKKMIGNVLSRPEHARLQNIECTIAESNTPSWGLFTSVARSIKAQLSQIEHFAGSHDSELAVSIGPFDSEQAGAVLDPS